MNTIFKRSNSGFTLPEVLVSILLLGGVLLTYLAAQNMYRFISAYSKHKIQAIYVAERMIEEQRRQPFAGLASGPLGVVSIDTKGTFNTTADDLFGNAVLTVTNLAATRKRLQVEINWRERSPAGTVTLREYCTTDVANEDELN